VLWGLWQALGLILHRLWSQWKSQRWQLPAPVGWAITFVWVLFGWMLFRAESVDAIYRYVSALGRFSPPVWTPSYALPLFWLIVPFFIFQFAQWKRDATIPFPMPTLTRAVCQGLLAIGILIYAQSGVSRPFIYFQF